MKQKRIVVFTGAGVSRESGLKTFRDGDGLWMGYNIEEVATPDAWIRDRKKVQDFYNRRRTEVLSAHPNAAHQLIADLQTQYDVVVITQNIDDLHERAGSKKVVHLHGEILKMRSDKNSGDLIEIHGDIAPDARAADGGFLRPHVVWFGEAVPEMEAASRIMTTAGISIVVGTSLQVYPAAGLIYGLPGQIPRYLVDPNPPQDAALLGFEVIPKKAVEGMRELYEKLMGG